MWWSERTMYRRGWNKNKGIKLSEEDVKKVRELRESGVSVKNIAERYGVSSRTIYRRLNE